MKNQIKTIKTFSHTEGKSQWVSRNGIFKSFNLTLLDCHAMLAMTFVNTNNKKAAMFGLDARIALAIFGALSVITGAALYSAISTAKATTLLTDLKEIGKAWEAYYLDTGVYMPMGSDTGAEQYMLQTSYLVEKNAIKGWQGPYTSYNVNGKWLSHTIHKNVHLNLMNDNATWGDSVLWSDAGVGFCTVADSKCFVWAEINGVSSVDTINKVDKIVDGGDGLNKGNFRATIETGSPYDNRALLKIAPYKFN